MSLPEGHGVPRRLDILELHVLSLTGYLDEEVTVRWKAELRLLSRLADHQCES